MPQMNQHVQGQLILTKVPTLNVKHLFFFNNNAGTFIWIFIWKEMEFDYYLKT